ncbi:NADH-quinone oxidoreductase subunit J [Spongiactinospora sp. TRM90649]|uniref:NADH-quinone oxidoreductase subunit J n=1 Tax=Spongiactinospora sp. TRM90649 TaxID=3031114 RepID=UPI0023F9C225|nr:NADH-quinone oxidoreductase subunit J [Spongiactinospora sp. TRM90649]
MTGVPWASAAFWTLAVVAVTSGVAVFRVDSMARATFALLTSFVAVGLAFLLIDLAYLGVLIVLMMIMEMMVMAIFMIMFMMNPAGLMPMTMVHNRRGAAIIAAVVFALLAAGVFAAAPPVRRGRPPADPAHALGLAIMGDKMLVMMVVGAAILATIVAAVVLSVAQGRYDRGRT